MLLSDYCCSGFANQNPSNRKPDWFPPSVGVVHLGIEGKGKGGEKLLDGCILLTLSYNIYCAALSQTDYALLSVVGDRSGT